MIDAGDTQVIQESFRESVFKDHYFVSGIEAGIGSCIAKRFKDQAPKSNIFLEQLVKFYLR